MKDVLDLNLQLFLRNLLPEHTDLEREMIAYAEENHVSIVEPEVGYLLNFMVRLLQPKAVLEIGTAIGFSTIQMAKALPEDGKLTTIELLSGRHELAQENFKKAGVADKIDAVLGDAREIIPQLSESYDLIFWDAAKGQYPDFLVAAEKHLKPNGLLIADNVLINGWVVNLDYPERRKKTMVYRMKDFLEHFKTNEKYQCSVLPLGDGVALIQKRERDGLNHE